MPSLIQFVAMCVILLWAVCLFNLWEKNKQAKPEFQMGIVPLLIASLGWTIIILVLMFIVVFLGYVAAGGMG